MSFNYKKMVALVTMATVIGTTSYGGNAIAGQIEAGNSDYIQQINEQPENQQSENQQSQNQQSENQKPQNQQPEGITQDNQEHESSKPEETVSTELTTEHTTEQSTEKPTEQSTEKPTEQPTENSTESGSEVKGCDGLEAGKYSISASSGNKMFNITECTLTVKNGSMSVTFTLHGTGYDYLYAGTAAQAENDSKNWVGFVKNSEGYYTYTLPISTIKLPYTLASRSARYKKWYDRTITFDISSLKPYTGSKPNKEDNSNGNSDSGSKPNNDKDSSGNPSGNKPSNNSNSEGSTGSKPSNNSNGESSSGSKNDGSVENKPQGESSKKDIDKIVNSYNGKEVADGTYTPSFGFHGGTGRTKISCNTVVVNNGKATATIVFDSTHYTYVRVGGQKYYNTNAGGNSTFVIPINLNSTTTINALTTAMSEPHEIQYVLYIYVNGKDVSSIKPEKTYETDDETAKKEEEEKNSEEKKDETDNGVSWGEFGSIQSDEKTIIGAGEDSELSEAAESSETDTNTEELQSTSNNIDDKKSFDKGYIISGGVGALIGAALMEIGSLLYRKRRKKEE